MKRLFLLPALCCSLVIPGCGGSGVDVSQVGALNPSLLSSRDFPAETFTTDEFPPLCSGESLFLHETLATAKSKIYQLAVITVQETAAQLSDAETAGEEFGQLVPQRLSECVRSAIFDHYSSGVNIVHPDPRSMSIGEEAALDRYRVLDVDGNTAGTFSFLTLRKGSCVAVLVELKQSPSADHNLLITLGKTAAARLPRACRESG